MMKRQPSGFRRLFYVLLGGLLLVLLLVWGMRPTPRLVDVEPVTRGHLEVAFEAEGRTRVIEPYAISAPIAAQARRLRLDVGDAVAAGEVVATLDPLAAPALNKRDDRQAKARVEAAASDLEAWLETARAAEAAADLAAKERSRMRRLADRDMVSRTQVDQADAEARRTRAELAAARHRVSAARQELVSAGAELGYAGERESSETGVLQLRSPVSGRILSRAFESERVVQPGDPILEIGDPGELEIEVDVLSSDAVRLAPGMRVLLERWGQPEPLEAQVGRIEPTGFTKISALGVEEQRVWVIADFVSPRARWERLGHGYRVNARFVLWESEDVLQVPTSSLFRSGDEWAVFRLEDGRARLVTVRIGRRGALRTQLIAGLDVGQEVIVHPDREIDDGVRVEARR
ncbi:efflux RND transporter periplasmic adaptor subunit [Imhoffiella purpurea]|uniref:Efflux transporter, RND family, MFP subunit n=1 Tax=Imhoffiella purpurea TaxID=1249627 RepID=W9V5B9_9GAMM|nr:HlyD family efflux transporter periplasmic adaptor subunit [Imhoffiella purpurea]EXJ14529.1 efflux transporter, RND family, MFP subunit [Imhoffiella purpurea]